MSQGRHGVVSSSPREHMGGAGPVNRAHGVGRERILGFID
ncbi:Hypothetical protein EPM1_1298 [Stenotrophomonas maltophilia EPM1]|nr:Hypothetical protein EPM1_1298 [Stenotrophomonas maltophilia EPM1]